MTNHLWQSTVFALVAAVLAAALRSNRAQVRYWVWFSASLKFFVPFALLMSVGSHVAPTKHLATKAVSFAIEQAAQPFPETVALTTITPSRNWIPIALATTWAIGFLVIAIIRFRGWQKVRAAIRVSTPIDIAAPVEIRQSPGLLEPGVVGLLRPTLLVPEGILDRLTPSQWDAVLTHELCHIRRRDNLFAAIHMAVEAIFWFHPFIWMIGARLVEERERACDEEVLRHGGEPRVYAEAILSVCKLYVESPLACLSGVTGADLKRRIEAIMTNRLTLNLSLAKKVALASAAIMALTVPIAVGILKAQTPATTIPKFEVASIKPCAGGGPSANGKGGGRGGAGGGDQGPSPDRLTMNCQPLRAYIRMAYVMFENGKRNFGPATPIEGGPGWVDSERYQITAKAEGTPGQEMMRGPMLQALLQGRFKLKIRRETREVPAYALTVAKNGPKLKPFDGESCLALDGLRPPPLGPDSKPFCALRMLRHSEQPSALVQWEVHGGTLDDLARGLGIDLDRIVVNQTEIAGKFDFKMEFAADETTAGLNSMRGPNGPVVTPGTASDPSGGPSVFTAIQSQLGLKLESAKSPREFLIIDRVEKPAEN